MMDQALRNKLRNVVTKCRKLLEDAVSEELQGKFGIYVPPQRTTDHGPRTTDVHVEDEARMGHLGDEDRACRQDLLDHFQHIIALGYKPKDALAQLVREVAFTHLNRLCAYKMMEAREVWVGGQRFREAVSRGLKSQGFLFYLAQHPEDEQRYNTGHQDVAYRHFLDWLGGTLSEEIGVLFSPTDPANRLYPPQRVLDDVLDLLNTGGIKPEEKELQEAWPQIWSQDETIGWVYQYFTPKELRDQARKESAAPRNSYELAFRNQFFTPRYVVQFLTDNTLGRIWYEMRQGETKLTEQCSYMVRRPNEVFLTAGQEPPAETEQPDDLPQEELLKQPVHIPHRPKKDPRELRILDPACGSGHFLLYCFDLLQTIYEEAWSDPDLPRPSGEGRGEGLRALRDDYPTLDALRRDVPRLILAHNLHGIDIDLRATQIAALALWLRSQRAYKDMGLTKDRPLIKRSNLVCAEPMPGEKEMLNEFVAELQPRVLGHLVEVVFDKMTLAAEAGSLLKIEEELRSEIASVRKQWVAEHEQAVDRKGRPLLFSQADMDRARTRTLQPQLFDFAQITDEQFWTEAEGKVLGALRDYASHAANAGRLRRQLFAEDANHGFAFVDISQKRFDIVLMNPPFGEPTAPTRSAFKNDYPTAADNLTVAFLLRARLLSCDNGRIGAITDCSWSKKYDYTTFREWLVSERSVALLVDLGWSVMDTANVEANLTVFDNAQGELLAADLKASDSKASDLARITNEPTAFRQCSLRTIAVLPNRVFAYDMPLKEVQAYKKQALVTKSTMVAVAGVKSCKSEADFRTWWEVPENEFGGNKTWEPLHNGSPYCPFHYPTLFAVRTDRGQWTQLMSFGGARPGETRYRALGLAYGKRTDEMYAYVMRPGQVFSQEGQALFPLTPELLWVALQLANSSVYSRHANHVAGQHKYHRYLNLICLPTDLLGLCGTTARSIFLELSTLDFCNETTLGFVSCNAVPEFSFNNSSRTRHKYASERMQRVKDLREQGNREILDAMSVQGGSDELTREVDYYETYFGSAYDDKLVARNALSYGVGCAFERWDFRLSLKDDATEKLDPLAAENGLPMGHALRQASMCEVRVCGDQDGILVDDPEHTDDIVRRVRDVLELIWKDRAEAIEKEACEILGVKGLRDYFRKPGNGGFWADHVSRYSRSRRKAPIYWLLQSSKKNYALWLYYHRLDKDILFKALLNYVEPKIRLVSGQLSVVRGQLQAAKDQGQGTKDKKRLDKEIEKQEDFLSELRDFEDKLRRAANLHLEPDLNDGVVLNIAPLWELVPWKDAKEYWEELMEGKYQWSSIGKQLRQKGLVRC